MYLLLYINYGICYGRFWTKEHYRYQAKIDMTKPKKTTIFEPKVTPRTKMSLEKGSWGWGLAQLNVLAQA